LRHHTRRDARLDQEGQAPISSPELVILRIGHQAAGRLAKIGIKQDLELQGLGEGRSGSRQESEWESQPCEEMDHPQQQAADARTRLASPFPSHERRPPARHHPRHFRIPVTEALIPEFLCGTASPAGTPFESSGMDV
jgi:hypothetical protein